MVHLTPQCPICKSARTGFKIAYTGHDPGAIIARHMRRGELVSPSPLSFDNNLFCADCGVEWSGDIFTKRLSKEEITKLKAAKGINTNLIDAEENAFIYSKLLVRKNRQTRFTESFFNGLIGFNLPVKWKPNANRNIQKGTEQEKQKKRGLIGWMTGMLISAIVDPLKDMIPKKFDTDADNNREE